MVVRTSERFVALAPFAPRFPFETWILPRRTTPRSRRSPTTTSCSISRGMLKDVLMRLNARSIGRPTIS